MGEFKVMVTPIEPNLKLKWAEGKILKDPKQYRQLVYSLIYLTITRPEIAYSVEIVSQFMQTPRIAHLDAAKRILRYIKGSFDYGLMYNKEKISMLNGYYDTDWPGDINHRHSTFG